MAKKVYAVRKGRTTGIFRSWEECRAQVDGYSGAEYKGFTDLKDAEAFLGVEGQLSSTEDQGMEKRDLQAERGQMSGLDSDTAIAYVDGSYNKVNRNFSCGVVFLYQGEEITFYESFSDEELASMRNVAGEIKGAESAMRYAKEHGVKKLVIYHDYEGIAKWCNGAWQAAKEGTKAYRAFYQEISKEMEIRFEKVKGHSGDHYNDMADLLARKALGLDKLYRL